MNIHSQEKRALAVFFDLSNYIKMSYIKKMKIGALIVSMAMVVAAVTSCSNDDTEEPVLHQSYVQGKLNNNNISINDINANILADKSDYDFSSGNQTDIPQWLDWNVNLIETKDSVVTLYLHLDDLNKGVEKIFPPSAVNPIKYKSTCYVTVRNLRNNTTVTYHPAEQIPMNAEWKTFMVEVGKEYKVATKHYDYKAEFAGHRWPGIEGSLEGVLVSDEALVSPITINVRFRLY